MLADLSRRLAGRLETSGLKQLDAARLRRKDRALTQQVSRLLFDDREAGIKFNSHLDERPCYAFFEFRSHLKPTTPAISLSDEIPELVSVCREYGLTLS